MAEALPGKLADAVRIKVYKKMSDMQKESTWISREDPL